MPLNISWVPSLLFIPMYHVNPNQLVSPLPRPFQQSSDYFPSCLPIIYFPCSSISDLSSKSKIDHIIQLLKTLFWFLIKIRIEYTVSFLPIKLCFSQCHLPASFPLGPSCSNHKGSLSVPATLQMIPSQGLHMGYNLEMPSRTFCFQIFL